MWNRALFTLEGWPIIAGWTKGETWNGWACPAFEREAAQAIVTACNATGGEVQSASYDEANDTFVFSSGPGDREVFEAVEIETAAGRLKVWEIGSCGWCWWENGERCGTCGDVQVGGPHNHAAPPWEPLGFELLRRGLPKPGPKSMTMPEHPTDVAKRRARNQRKAKARARRSR